jgi:uncharacterized protein YceH (UPF0502 family)
MLRGPQTVGEIRGRSARMYDFAEIAQVAETLQGLMQRGEGAYVAILPRQPGRKEPRYAHLFSGAPIVAVPDDDSAIASVQPTVTSDDERIGRLEEEISALRRDLATLNSAFLTFKKQFD